MQIIPDLKYSLFVFLAGAALFLVFVLCNFTIKRKVRAKTAEMEISYNKLKKSEENYRELVENSNSVILRFDTLGNINYFNEFAEKFFGWRKEEILGKKVVDTIVPKTESTGRDLEKMIAEIIADPDRFVNNANENMRKNGERIWIIWTNKPVYDKDGKLTGIMSIGNDITAQKRAQESCLETEARFRALSESSPDIVYTMDRSGSITYVNPAWKLLLGHEKEEVLGHYFIDFAKKEDRGIYKKLFKNIRDEGKAVNNFIGGLLTKDGEERTFNMYGAFIEDSQGRPLGIVSSLKDFTEYQKMEKKLNNSQRLESIGTLAGGIAHDFNNLLMGILGYTSLMLLKTNDSDPNYQRLRHIEEQVDRGANLTKQLLGFAREGRYEQKPSDMNKIIAKTSELFGRTKKEISIDLLLEPDLLDTEVDPGQMEQMLMNLYVNAGQAMPDGGTLNLMTNSIILDEGKAKANEIEPGAYIRLSIKDSGVGMDKKTIERIFDPFFTTKTRGRGTGLGLATVYGIVKGHRGMIEVTSESGHGTAFSIYLPAIQKEGAGTTEAAKKGPGVGETILLVDDEKTVLETTKELISLLGYRVYPVGSGQEALATFLEKRGEIDLVVLDMIMPGISGSVTFDRLREIDPEVRVLLSSGYSIDGQARDIMDRGCKGFIQKPFRMEELSRKLRAALDE
ncbi:MAG: PAS domain S-box protein [Syntrophales bacterium]|jgi:PAS domain S-box-containing protein|nr:PAS domain S-box protein [Syntrophales bacterium]